MKKIFLLLLTLLVTAINAFASDKELSAAQFLYILRDGIARNHGSSYAILDGYMEHIRRGADEPIEYPLFMGIIITPERIMTQIIVNEDEGYFVSQTKENNLIPMHKNLPSGSSKLEQSGLDPADLSMNFIYYDLVEELPKAKVKMLDCRVFLLKNPKKNELVKIYVAEKFFFTLKAEFFNELTDYQANKATRTIEISSFKKQNELYYVEEFNIYGPGCRTIVSFEEAEVNTYDPTKNKLIFRQLKK